jgi:hypothetical protein
MHEKRAIPPNAHACFLLFLDFDMEETRRFGENENMVAKMPKVSAL